MMAKRGRSARHTEAKRARGTRDRRGGRRAKAQDDRQELIETLSALLLQQRLVEFADELDGDERTILDERMLAPRPASIASIAERLGLSYRRAAAKVQELEQRLREALRDPALA